MFAPVPKVFLHEVVGHRCPPSHGISHFIGGNGCKDKTKMRIASTHWGLLFHSFLRCREHVQFFKTIPESLCRKCISKFINATGNATLTSSICAICAGSFLMKNLTDVKIVDLCAKKKLSPSKPHPAQCYVPNYFLLFYTFTLSDESFWL